MCIVENIQLKIVIAFKQFDLVFLSVRYSIKHWQSKWREIKEDQWGVCGKAELDADGAEEAAGGQTRAHKTSSQPDTLWDTAENSSQRPCKPQAAQSRSFIFVFS